MPDYAQYVIFWIAGTLFGLGAASRGEKDVKNICALALGSLACAIALVFLLGVTGEVLQSTNVSALIDKAAATLTLGDRREKATPMPTPAPTPTPTPLLDHDCPQEMRQGRPDWLTWLLFTPDREG